MYMLNIIIMQNIAFNKVLLNEKRTKFFIFLILPKLLNALSLAFSLFDFYFLI